MPEFLVLHLGPYAPDQLREEQGHPSLQGKVVNATGRDAAIREAAPLFETFGPLGLCVAIPMPDDLYGQVASTGSDDVTLADWTPPKPDPELDAPKAEDAPED